MSPIVLGSSGVLVDALATRLDAVVMNPDAALPAGATGVVITVGPHLRDHASPFDEVDDTEWHRLCEDPMRRTLGALQRSRRAMSAHGGRIVLLTPTIGMAGAPGLVALGTAVEGVRAMTKSAARQWASRGILVNAIAAPLRLFAPALDASASHLGAAALQDDDTLLGAIAETAGFLLRTDVGHLVGATVVVDGGSVMLP